MLQTKTDAAAFAVRVRASHKLGTVTGGRTKDGRWAEGAAGTEPGRQTMARKHSRSNRLMSC